MASNLARVAMSVRRPALRWLARADRRLGRAVREWSDGRPAVRSLAVAAARALSPAFRGLVALLCLRRRTRGTGLSLLAGAAGASLLARAARDRLDRRRPGARPEGGFPSRHAAAATAIAMIAGRRRPGLGIALGAAAAAGLAGRVVSADHEPADVVAGAALGAAVALAARPVRAVAFPRAWRKRMSSARRSRAR